ncbi:MAG: hypothetical protein JWQ38_3643 [Flavipsychrobacter sp.]|nr:hypothetical protein [Flavipsychrobacter sp.]
MKKSLYLSHVITLLFLLFGNNTNAQYTITAHFESPACSDAQFYVLRSGGTGLTPGLTLKTYFGDGTDTVHMIDSASAGFGHRYTSAGVYTVKHVLLNSGSAIVSVAFSYKSTLCHTVALLCYLDNNSNCTFEPGDEMLVTPYTVEIDSAGIPIDTTTTTSLYFDTRSPLGTIYTFKMLKMPSGLSATCPVTATTSITVGSTLYAYMGFECIGTSGGFDLSESVSVGGPGRHQATATVTVTNPDCTPHAATLTMSFSPKYNFADASPAPSSVAGTVITWNLTGVSSVTPKTVFALFTVPSPWLIAGDTVHSSYVITQETGEADTTNNVIVRIDTVKSSYDPNEKSVTPQGVITAGTNLVYNIQFENTGNAPAENIHVQDTLSDYVDLNTFKLISSSANVFTGFSKDMTGHNVIKFDFPGIHLLDSSHHGQCDGMVSFTINAKNGLANGTKIDNRAGIYFDDNEVVMTNTVENVIGIPTEVSVMTNNNTMSIYPNPVNDILIISTITNAYNELSITNTIGQSVLTQTISTPQTRVNVKALPSGLYYITLKGEGGVKVQKFEKL